MTEERYYIGMDVHKDSVQMAVFEQTGDEPIYERKLNNDLALLVKEAKRFSQKGETETAYEAGCLGYVIRRAFEKAGITCHVLPAISVPNDADEATRDLLRRREDASEDVRRAIISVDL